MCRILAVIQRKNKTNIDLSVMTAFMAATTENFKSNNDGEGIFKLDSVEVSSTEKSLNKLLPDTTFIMEPYQMLLDHTRKATSEVNEQSIQPFVDYVLGKPLSFMHNGVMTLKDFPSNRFGKKDNISDSYYFYQKLKEFLIENKGNMYEAIQSVLDEVYEHGSMSILISYGEDLYYFKNVSTSIHFYITDTAFLISTSDNIVEYLPGKVIERTIQPSKLYMFSRTDKTLNDTIRYKVYTKDLEIVTAYQTYDYNRNSNFGHGHNSIKRTEKEELVPLERGLYGRGWD